MVENENENNCLTETFDAKKEKDEFWKRFNFYKNKTCCNKNACDTLINENNKLTNDCHIIFGKYHKIDNEGKIIGDDTICNDPKKRNLDLQNNNQLSKYLENVNTNKKNKEILKNKTDVLIAKECNDESECENIIYELENLHNEYKCNIIDQPELDTYHGRILANCQNAKLKINEKIKTLKKKLVGGKSKKINRKSNPKSKSRKTKKKIIRSLRKKNNLKIKKM